MENSQVCTVLVGQGAEDSAPSYLEMQKRIEKAGQVYMQKKSGESLAGVLEELLVWMMNGESYGKLLMPVIRYMVNCEDHKVKKLLQLYFELCDKLTPSQELKEEMILVCNALLKDLNSHNEFVRGSTLRLLCRLRYYKLIEPLIPSIILNLQHRHNYVRRYAVICVYAVCKSFGLQAVPEASAAVEAVLITEGDISTKRNCLLFLLQFDIDKCVRYVLSLGDQVCGLGDICQLVVVELSKKIAKIDFNLYTNKFRPILFNLMQSNSPAVAYDACVCALSFAKAGTGGDLTVVECINKLVLLLFNQSDNAVKLVILDRLEELRPELLADCILDLLRALSTNPSISVRKRILNLTLAAVQNGKSAETIVAALVKELDGKVELSEAVKVDVLGAIRSLVSSIGAAAATHLTDALLDQVAGVAAGPAAVALATLRDLWAHEAPPTEPQLAKLRNLLTHVKGGSEIVRGALWLLSEFDLAAASNGALLGSLLTAVGALPLKEETNGAFRSKNHFRAALLHDDLLRSLVALVVARGAFHGAGGRKYNEAVFLVANLARLGDPSGRVATGRLALVLRALTTGDRAEGERLLNLASSGADLAREALERLARSSAIRAPPASSEEAALVKAKPSSTVLNFRQLSSSSGASAAVGDAGASLFGKEVLAGEEYEKELSLDERLERTIALTGLSDAVYIEGCVLGVRSYGTMQLELWVYNRTSEVVQNLSIDLFPEGSGQQGALRVVERENLQVAILKAGEARRLRVNVKIEATTSARLHGCVAFEDKKHRKTQLLIAPIESDILDFLPAASAREGGITVEDFKRLWAELEWENKVNLAVPVGGNFESALVRVMRATNMTIVGVKEGKKAEGRRISEDEAKLAIAKLGELLKIDFISVNLHAKTIFGEDALANVSLQVDENNKVSGSVRIRARTQGIALSLGEKISKLIK